LLIPQQGLTQSYYYYYCTLSQTAELLLQRNCTALRAVI
jgi:hypothetical protein